MVVNGSIDVTPYVTLRETVDVVTVTQDAADHAERGRSTAFLTTAGPDRDQGGLAQALQVLGRPEDATLLFLALGWGPEHLPVNHLVSALDASGLQLLQVAGLDYQRLMSVLVAVYTTDPVAYRDLQGRGTDSLLPRLTASATSRLVNEHLLLDATTRSQARRAAASSVALRAGLVSADAGDPARLDALRQENARLTLDLQRTCGAQRSLERKIARIEASTSLRLGQALVGAAKDPARGARVLPRTALDMWRARGGRSPVRPEAPAAASSNASPPSHDVTGGREFLRWSTTTWRPQRRVSVVGAVTAPTARALTGSTSFSPVLPHTAAEVLRRTEPDLFIVESAVAARYGPWAHLGEPGTPERDRDLLAAVRECQSAGVPIVWWRNAPSWTTAGLHWLAAECDLVIDGLGAGEPQGTSWSPGVDLTFASGLTTAEGRQGVVYRGSWPERGRAGQRKQLGLALEAAVPHGLSILEGEQDESDQWPADLRCHVHTTRGYEERRILAARAVSIEAAVGAGSDTLPSTTSLEHLAAGLRLVSTVDHVGHGATVLHGEHPAPAAVAEAVRQGALRPREHRDVLQTLFLEHSSGAAVGHLLSALGASAVDPMLHRAVAVDAHVHHLDEAQRLADAVAAQRWRPRRLRVTTDGFEADRVFDEVLDRGTAVTLVTGVEVARDRSERDEGWHVQWDGRRWGPDHLLNLALWGEVTGADAVKPPEREDGGSKESAGCLLRSDALTHYGPPGPHLLSWSGAGARVVDVPAALDADR